MKSKKDMAVPLISLLKDTTFATKYISAEIMKNNSTTTIISK